MVAVEGIEAELEVDEPWLGLWLPLNYQIDMGSSLAYDNGIWGEPYRLFAAKFLFVGVFFFFWFVLKVVFVIGSAVDRLCG